MYIEDYKLAELEKRIGYAFTDRELLIEALTHSSFVNELTVRRIECNERLEFLGDAVLELAVSTYLFSAFPNTDEGSMSAMRADCVCERALAACARKFGLSEFLLLGRGERLNFGAMKDSILSDAFEAVIGAIYSDSGFESATEFINKFVISSAEEFIRASNYKTLLQIFTQKTGLGLPEYNIVSETMKEGNTMLFECVVSVGGSDVARGFGKNKKQAQTEAAKNALAVLEDKDDK